MFTTIPINYVYMDKSIQEKFKTAENIAKWGKGTILTQIAQTYGKVNLDYYAEAAELDAVARGFKQHQGEHFDLLSSWQDLPKYVESRPIFKPSPIAAIPIPDSSMPRVSFSRFHCSKRNAAVLKIALIVDNTNIQILMSQLFVWYYARYWDLYKPQLEAVEQRCIKPDLSAE